MYIYGYKCISKYSYIYSISNLLNIENQVNIIDYTI